MKKIYKKISILLACILSQSAIHSQCGVPANLGTATNMVGLIRNNSSAVAANKTLNTVTFIHRNNVSLFGGNSGHLRFDISTNGGTNWTLNQGVMNPISTNPSRYPNIAIYNPPANTNTANAYLSYMAPTINTVSSTFNGVATGVTQFNASGATETYNQNGIGTTMLPSSLVTGSTGIFWAIEPLLSPSGFNIYKGVWNSGTSDVVWALNYQCTPTFLYFPSTVFQDYTIAFDPTGTIGYFCFTGHVNSGPSGTTLYPILYKTTNGGTSWTGPIIVDVTNLSCITSNTVSPNLASMNDGHDLVVDVNGNPHLITTLGNSSGYTFNYNLWHHMYDITLKNGVWAAYDLGNVNCGPNTFGTTTTYPQAQAPQASRSSDGTKIFFTWTDNASASLGNANNTPDLFGKAYNVSNDTWTPTKNFTSCNAATSGKIIFPHSAAEVLEPNSSTFLVPVVYGEPSVTNNLDLTANFKYLDNVTFATSEFSLTVPPATVTIQQAPLAIICPNSSLTLNVAGNAGQAIWNTGATTTTLSITSGTATSYSVVAQVGCNVGSATIAVTNLSVTLSSLTPSVCPGNPANFTASGNAFGYTWTPGNATGTNVTLNPVVNTITLSARGSNSCISTQTISVNLLSPPTITIAGTNTICAGTILTQVASGAQSYVWDNNATGATFTDTPLVNTSYTVTGTAANTCTNTQTVSVVVKPSPTLTTLSTQTAVCAGETVSITASGAVSYSWNANPSPPAFSASPNVTSTYTVTGAGLNLCESSKTVTIIAYPLPSLTVTPARSVFCKGEKIKLTATGATNYTWTTQGLLSSTVQVNPVQTTTYALVGISSDGCYNSTSYVLVVSACVGIDSQEAANSLIRVFPNPNNGEFTIKGEGELNLTLVNELGQSVKNIIINESNSYEVSLKELTPGIYFIVGQQNTLQIKSKIVVSK